MCSIVCECCSATVQVLFYNINNYTGILELGIIRMPLSPESVIYIVQLRFKYFLCRFPANVSFSGRSREGLWGHNDDQVSGCDALVQVSPGVEVPCFPENVLL
jgi:hypothetical protein